MSANVSACVNLFSSGVRVDKFCQTAVFRLVLGGNGHGYPIVAAPLCDTAQAVPEATSTLQESVLSDFALGLYWLSQQC